MPILSESFNVRATLRGEKPGSMISPEASDPLLLYTIIEKVGQGSYGKIYKCISKSGPQIIALKVIDLEQTQDDIEDLLFEVDFQCKCDSPYLARYHGSWLFENKLSIAMEYLGGGTLDELMNHSSLSEKQCGFVMREILRALFYMHKSLKIHRDIKPANILFDNTGELKLADFGVAAQMSLSQKYRQTFCGTPLYLAPEIILSDKYTGQVDIWSLGIMAIELATGTVPRATQHPMDILYAIPIEDSPKLPATFSTDFQSFVSLCLIKNPAKRATSESLLKHPFIVEADNFDKSAIRRALEYRLVKNNAQQAITPSIDQNDWWIQYTKVAESKGIVKVEVKNGPSVEARDSIKPEFAKLNLTQTMGKKKTDRNRNGKPIKPLIDKSDGSNEAAYHISTLHIIPTNPIPNHEFKKSGLSTSSVASKIALINSKAESTSPTPASPLGKPRKIPDVPPKPPQLRAGLSSLSMKFRDCLSKKLPKHIAAYPLSILQFIGQIHDTELAFSETFQQITQNYLIPLMSAKGSILKETQIKEIFASAAKLHTFSIRLLDIFHSEFSLFQTELTMEKGSLLILDNICNGLEEHYSAYSGELTHCIWHLYTAMLDSSKFRDFLAKMTATTTTRDESTDLYNLLCLPFQHLKDMVKIFNEATISIKNSKVSGLCKEIIQFASGLGDPIGNATALIKLMTEIDDLPSALILKPNQLFIMQDIVNKLKVTPSMVKTKNAASVYLLKDIIIIAKSLSIVTNDEPTEFSLRLLLDPATLHQTTTKSWWGGGSKREKYRHVLPIDFTAFQLHPSIGDAAGLSNIFSLQVGKKAKMWYFAASSSDAIKDFALALMHH